LRRFFKVPKRLLYKKYFFFPLSHIKAGKIDKSLKSIFVAIFFKLKKKWVRNKLLKNRLNLKKKNKIKKIKNKNFNKIDFLTNLKKLYKKKKLNFLFIRKKMYRKIRKTYKLHSSVKKHIKDKKMYLKFYKYRGSNNRSLLKRTMISNKSKKYSNIAWLKVGLTYRKLENWWMVRELKRRVAFYYGFVNMRKFRYINNFNKNMAVNSNYGMKLECMLNIFFLRLNFFDNIFQVNNLIRKTRFINIDNKLCTYPYRIINVFQTVSINKFYFKKMLNIFIKRCKFNKSYMLKNFTKKGYKRKKLMKNLVNIPNFIEYNYKIMHFTIIDRPKLSQLKSYGYGLGNSSLFTWSVNTKIRYDYK